MSDGKINSSSRYIRVGLPSVACLLAVVFARQTWLGSASLNDPRATPRTVTARGELFPTSDPRSIYSDKPRLQSSTSQRSAWSGIYSR